MESITLIENETPLIPIKTDQAGRRRLSNEHKEALLDAFEASSMSGARFARQYGLVYPTFASWVKKRKESREAPVAKSSPLGSLVEIDLTGASQSGLTIELPQGARIHLNETGQVALAAALIKNLAQ